MANPAIRRISVPLSAGQREDIDPKVASLFGPEGIIKSAVNLLLRKDGRLGVRNGVGPVNMATVSSGSTLMRAKDLASFNERLYAPGALSAQTAADRVYELANPTPSGSLVGFGAAPPWFTATQSETRLALNVAHAVRKVFGSGRLEAGLLDSDCAAANGFLCIVYKIATNQSRVLVVRPVNGAVLANNVIAADRVQVVALSTNVFMIAGVNSGNGVDMWALNPAASGTVTPVTQLFANNANAITAFAFAAVTGAANVIGFIDRGAATNATIHRADATGATVGSDISIAGTNTIGAAIESNNTNVNAVLVETGGVASLRTHLLSSGALLNNTALFGSTAVVGTFGSPGIVRSGVNIVCFGQSTQVATTFADTEVDARVEASHAAFLTAAKCHGLTIKSRPMLSSNWATPVIFWGATRGGYDNHGTDPRDNVLMGMQLHPSAPNTNSTVQEAATLDHFAGGLGFGTNAPPGGGCVDSSTGLMYWVANRVDPVSLASASSQDDLVVYEVTPSLGRRHMAAVGGQVIVSGGAPQCHDGTELGGAGLQAIPDIVSLAQGASGSLTLLGVYKYVLVHERIDRQGKRIQSRVSEERTITLTGANNSVVATVSLAKDWGAVAAGGVLGTSVALVLYRTVAGGEIFRRTRAQSPGGSYSAFTQGNVFVMSDDATADSALGEILYTSGDVGGLSGVLEDGPAPSCTMIAVGAKNCCAVGLSEENRYQVSKQFGPGEPVHFTPGSEVPFLGETPDACVGAWYLDERLLLFTRAALYSTTSDGPSDAGIIEGDGINTPQLLSGECGLHSTVRGLEWRSLLEDKTGLWWQGHPDKIFLLQRGGAVPEWASRPVQSTLASFPVVTAAARGLGDYTNYWTLAATDGLSSRVIVRDARTGDWFVHEYANTLGASNSIVAACQFQDVMFFAESGAAGNVFAQDATGFIDRNAAGTQFFIPTTLEFNSLYPGGPGGEAQLVAVELKGEYRGNCVLEGFISYDDGKTYVTMGAVSITAANGYVLGDTVSYQRWPARRKGESFRVRFNVTTAGSATEGLVFNMVNFFAMAQDGAARRRPLDVA